MSGDDLTAEADAEVFPEDVDAVLLLAEDEDPEILSAAASVELALAAPARDVEIAAALELAEPKTPAPNPPEIELESDSVVGNVVNGPVAVADAVMDPVDVREEVMAAHAWSTCWRSC